MRHRIVSRWLLTPVFLAASASALAAELWKIDSGNSHVDFAVRLLWLKKLDGRFPYVEGQVQIERERADIAIRVAANALTMARPSHAEWARSPEFFDTERHPWILFQATGVPLERFEQGGDIEGAVSLRGITQPLWLRVEPSRCDEAGRDCRIHASGEVERSAFGMTARRVAVSDKVDLDFEVRLLRAETVTAPEITGSN